MEFIDAYPLYDLLAHREKPSEADAIFILGAGSLGPVKKAAELWRQGFAKYIAFTSKGGKFGGNMLFGKPEWQRYAEVLDAEGIPEKFLLYPTSELTTTNTLVEARTAIPFLDTQATRDEVTRVILVSRPVHQLRAWATFKKQWPAVQFFSCPCDEELTIEHLDRMLGELDRLREYADKGDTLKVEFPPKILAIEAELRRVLKPEQKR